MAKKKEVKNIEELLQEALIPKEEHPYEIPSNWEWVKLGKIANFIDYRGKTPEKISEGVRLITAKNIKMGYIDFNPEEFISESEYDKFMTRGFPEYGDVIITTEAPLGNVAQLNINEKFALAQRAITFKLINQYEKTLLKYYMMSPPYQEILKQNATGTTVLGIKASKLKDTAIILPPLSEQTRIVNKLESMLSKLKEAKEKIAEAKESFELRRASILHKAFTGELTKQWREEKGVNSEELTVNSLLEKINEEKIKNWEEECRKAELEGKKKPSKPKLKTAEEMKISNDEKPYDLPHGWEWVRLGDVAEINPSKEKYNLEDDEVCSFLPMRAISDDYGNIIEILEENYGKVKKGYTSFKENDVLFAKITPCMENGKCAIAKGLKNGFGFGTTEFHVFRGIYSIPELIYHFLRNTAFRNEASQYMTGSVGQKRVPKEYLENCLFPLPPLSEQQEVVARIEALLKAEDEAKDLLNMEEQIDLLEKSILSKAFRGEFGTNDPSDEPALELLKRVLGEEKEETPKIISTKNIPLPKKEEFKTVLDLIIHMKKIDITEIPRYIKMDISDLQNELLELKKQGKINEVRDGWKVILEAVE